MTKKSTLYSCKDTELLPRKLNVWCFSASSPPNFGTLNFTPPQSTMVKFNPTEDLSDLSGKVIIVTGANLVLSVHRTRSVEAYMKPLITQHRNWVFHREAYLAAGRQRCQSVPWIAHRREGQRSRWETERRGHREWRCGFLALWPRFTRFGEKSCGGFPPAWE